MSETKSCWNCAHKIGGEHCPMGRRKESALRAKILRVREGSESDEEAVRRLAKGKVGIRIGNGKDEMAEISDMRGSDNRYKGRSSEEVSEYKRRRSGRCGKGV